MPFVEITDPNELASLKSTTNNSTSNATIQTAQPDLPARPAQANQQSGTYQEITDPNELAQLQSVSTKAPPQHHLLNSLKEYAKSIPAGMNRMAGYVGAMEKGALEGAKDVSNFINSGIEKIAPSTTPYLQNRWSPTKVASELVQQPIPQDTAGKLLSAGTEAALQVGLTPELAEGKIAQLGSKFLRYPAKLLGQVAPQAVAGAALTPQNRQMGAAFGAGGKLADYTLGGLNKLAEVVDENIYPKKFVADSYDKIKNHYAKLLSRAKDSYKPVKTFSKESVLDTTSPLEKLSATLPEEGGSISPAQLKNYQDALATLSPEQIANPSKVDLASKLNSTISDPIDQINLTHLDNYLASNGGELGKSYQKLLRDGTVQAADDFKKKLSERAFEEGQKANSGNRELLTAIKNNLQKNVIAPKLDSLSPNAGQNYLFGDKIYQSLKGAFGNKNMAAIGKGDILNLSKTDLKKALQSVESSGGFSGHPMLANIYSELQRREAAHPYLSLLGKYISHVPGEKAVQALRSSKVVPASVNLANYYNPYLSM